MSKRNSLNIQVKTKLLLDKLLLVFQKLLMLLNLEENQSLKLNTQQNNLNNKKEKLKSKRRRREKKETNNLKKYSKNTKLKEKRINRIKINRNSTTIEN